MAYWCDRVQKVLRNQYNEGLVKEYMETQGGNSDFTCGLKGVNTLDCTSVNQGTILSYRLEP